jgi:hypothetical protein
VFVRVYRVQRAAGYFEAQARQFCYKNLCLRTIGPKARSFSIDKEASVGVASKSSAVAFNLPPLGDFHTWKLSEVVCFRLDASGKVAGRQRV